MGELAALATALCWAIAARFYVGLGKFFSPIALNLYKGIYAGGLLLLCTWLMPSAVQLSQTDILLLVFSGAVGIGIGDSCFFHALNKIGDTTALLVSETLAPIMTALFAMAWIGEWLTVSQWLAIAVIIFAIDMVIRLQKRESLEAFQLSGYSFAALAALCQALGAVISRDVLVNSGGDAIQTSTWRIAGGLMIIVPLLLWRKSSWLPKGGFNLSLLWRFVIATTLGTLMALVLQMLAFSLTKAAIVQTLFASSIIMSLVIARIQGQRMNTRVVVWAWIAMLGVAWLVLSDG